MKRALLCFVALGCAGCSGTPIPQPPPDNLEIGKIAFPEQATVAGGPVTFAGEPGAAPANSILLLTNLDGTDPPVATTVDGQGAFEATVVLAQGDELRFQVVTDSERLDPIDLLYTVYEFSPPVRIDCLSVALQADYIMATWFVMVNAF